MKSITTALIAITLLPVILLHAEKVQAEGAPESEQPEKRSNELKKTRKEMRWHNHSKMLDHKMKRIDANEDGKVSLAEYLGHAEQRFKRMDLDQDGAITGEEMREASHAMRKKHHQAMKKARKAHKKIAHKGCEADNLETEKIEEK